MRKILLLVVIATIILFLGKSLNQSHSENFSQTTPTIIPSSSPTSILKQTTEVAVAGKNYQVSYFKVGDVSRLTLYSNLAEKKTAEELKKNYRCQNLINGGFYDKSDHHLGLFISDGKTLSSELASNLFNGFFFVTSTGLIDITNTAPAKPSRLALQSGPLLWKEASPLVLKINNDELARRMAVVLTAKKEIYFLAVYDQDSPLQGPYLEDLPNLLLQFQANTKVSIASALNLDGGSASAFSNQEVTLMEIARVGSFFCLK